MLDIPTGFTGGWVRHGISLDGGPFLEDSIVWWLQSTRMHADLRVPRGSNGGSTCFAGVTTWDGLALTWTRAVDLERYDGIDTGTATWDGEDLLEAGEFRTEDGGTTTYVERWRRLPDSDGPLWAGVRQGVHALRAGAYAITLADERPSGGVFSGTAWSLTGAGWAMHHSLPGVGLAAVPPGPDESLTDWSTE